MARGHIKVSRQRWPTYVGQVDSLAPFERGQRNNGLDVSTEENPRLPVRKRVGGDRTNQRRKAVASWRVPLSNRSSE